MESFRDGVFFKIASVIPDGNKPLRDAFDQWQHAELMAWKHTNNQQVKQCSQEAKASMVAEFEKARISPL